nr:EOG090X0B12 [Eurycercus lamellatus]
MDPELSPEKTEKLVQFQELSGIEDLTRCIEVLERHNWDVETAIHDHLGLDPRERTPPVNNLPPPLFPQQNGLNGRSQGLVNGSQHRGIRTPQPNDRSIIVVIATFYQITSFVFRLILPIQRPAVTDPAGSVVSFIQEYDRTYGVQHPNFYPGTYSQVLNEAKKDLKFLLVYLHSKDHQDTERFCRRTLSDPQVIQYINENCLMWACNVDTSEGYRVSQSLRENTYPFIAVVVQRDFRMTVVGRIEGFAEPELLIQRIRHIVSDNEAFLVVARADREERSFTQALRQEQDQAYLESLRADQEKEEKKKRERMLEEERLKEIQQQEQEEQRKKDEMIKRKLEAVNQVPEEPNPNTEGVCRILVRLPSEALLTERKILLKTLQNLSNLILTRPTSPAVNSISRNNHTRILVSVFTSLRRPTRNQFLQRESAGLLRNATLISAPSNDDPIVI